jgi:hypothetical protein
MRLPSTIQCGPRCLALSALALLMLAACGGGGGEGSPAPAAPNPPPPGNSQELGARDNLLFWTPAQQQYSYRNMELIFPTRAISRTAGSPHPLYELTSAPMDLSSFRYVFQGVSYSLEDFIARNRVAGLIVVKDGRILVERYSFGHSAASKWT